MFERFDTEYEYNGAQIGLMRFHSSIVDVSLRLSDTHRVLPEDIIFIANFLASRNNRIVCINYLLVDSAFLYKVRLKVYVEHGWGSWLTLES